jgi:LETM1-like protein
MFFFRVHKSKVSYKYDSINYKQELKIRQVKSDFIKFIPFSLFIIVPGLELLLPAWLVIFPNSKPS